MPADPLTLRLPPWLVDRFELPRVIAESGDCTRSAAFRLLERFAMSGPEQAFVQTVLARRTNLWLYRCNQRAACGDFIVVDVSSPTPADRVAVAIELKAGAPLALGGARVQLANVDAAVAELVVAGVVGGGAVTHAYGDEAVVLTYLRAAPP
ncbi:MAG: hypothetical protein IPL61_29280 [Myxococcales bacterium]|nr:hypothetical protein [Myxococcales bacterium]